MMTYFRAYRAQQELHSKLKRKPTDEEVAAAIQRSVSTLRSVRQIATMKVYSAGEKTSEEPTFDKSGDNPASMLDLYVKPNNKGYEIDLKNWQIDFQQTLEENLSPTERKALGFRFGLFDGNCRTVQQTAELIGISTEGVRKTILCALEKLRKSPNTTTLKGGKPEMEIFTFNGYQSNVY
jgi:DNA-directed RNA polymerase sigma subunit (sigma70/sigma32)